MSTLHLEIEPSARAVTVTEDDLVVDLVDGRQISVPLAWYPRLLNATAAECQNCLLLGDGYAIEWPDLDEHVGLEGLLAGRTSGEGRQSLERWLASRRDRRKDQQINSCRIVAFRSAKATSFAERKATIISRRSLSDRGRRQTVQVIHSP